MFFCECLYTKYNKKCFDIPLSDSELDLISNWYFKDVKFKIEIFQAKPVLCISKKNFKYRNIKIIQIVRVLCCMNYEL